MARLLLAFLTLFGFATATSAAEPIKLEVDVRDAPRRMIHSKLVVPARPGPMTLLYPKWVPGTHGPTTPIADLAGFRVRAANTDIAWQRDENDPYAVLIDVPKGGTVVEVMFDVLLPGLSEAPRRQNTVATAKLAVLNFCDLLVYPKSPDPMGLQFELSLKLLAEWKHGSALPNIDEQIFKPVSLETLIDSPLLCGEYVKAVKIGPKHVVMLACDSEAGLEIPAEVEASWKKLVVEAEKLFGSQPFGTYTFLLALSDKIRPRGLEHHESSDNRLPEMALGTPHLRQYSAALFPHEYVHSWCGKFRCPVDMIVPDFQTMPKTKMLWVYEGLTNYLGWVLAARSGSWKPDDALDHLAITAEAMKNSRGRQWRSLEDTGSTSHLLVDARGGWGAYRRSLDYYDEGTLLWLEADVIIRRETKNTKSLDNFCKSFFKCEPGRPAVKGYGIDELVKELNAVAPFKWKEHFTRRVSLPTEEAPLDGIALGGWNLSYSTKATDAFKAVERIGKSVDLSASIGLKVSNDGTVLDAIPDSLGAKAGIVPGMKVFSVNGRKFTPELLQAAVATSKEKIDLILENGDFVSTTAVNYKGGARFPKLERTMAEPDLIREIITPGK